MPDRRPSGRLRISFALGYAAVSTIAGIAIVLVIWPGSSADVGWARTMSAEVRYLMIAAIGGVLGASLRATALLGASSAKVSRAPNNASLTVRALLAIQLAVLAYLVIRSFIILPTVPVSTLSPFGVLMLGLLAGAVAEDMISSVTARLLEPSNAELDSRLDRIVKAVGLTTLDNYHGQICARILRGGKDIAQARRDDGSLLLEPNCRYTLLAWFEPGSLHEGWTETISISGGNDVSRIAFTVTADSSTAIGFDPGRHVCSFDPKKASERFAFDFVTPVVETPFTLWLRVTQKERLSAVLALRAIASSRH